jgi:hypothetical protein
MLSAWDDREFGLHLGYMKLPGANEDVITTK